eukprot:TRINITY_DN37614_c0_g1_i1.p1 TRINITY_DN37614_c0_g1~~TRINITY_DN37614_c0_g1_i1.p1  ORF type:complete len:174 (+),score=41.53 TRINITY_DN37614_c0_g1_i1:98-619(+)
MAVAALPPTVDLSIKSLSGETLATLLAVPPGSTVASLTHSLRERAEPPPSHVYELLQGDAVLSGDSTLCDCGVAPPHAELLAVLRQSESEQAFVKAVPDAELRSLLRRTIQSDDAAALADMGRCLAVNFGVTAVADLSSVKAELKEYLLASSSLSFGAKWRLIAALPSVGCRD